MNSTLTSHYMLTEQEHLAVLYTGRENMNSNPTSHNMLREQEHLPLL